MPRFELFDQFLFHLFGIRCRDRDHFRRVEGHSRFDQLAIPNNRSDKEENFCCVDIREEWDILEYRVDRRWDCSRPHSN